MQEGFMWMDKMGLKCSLMHLYNWRQNLYHTIWIYAQYKSDFFQSL